MSCLFKVCLEYFRLRQLLYGSVLWDHVSLGQFIHTLLRLACYRFTAACQHAVRPHFPESCSRVKIFPVLFWEQASVL